MQTSRFLAAGVLLCSLSASQAAEPYAFVQGGLDNTAEAGLGVPLNDQWALRASIGRTRPGNATRRVDGSSDFKVHPEGSTTASVLADWFPVSGSGFRLSAGLRYGSSNGQSLSAVSGTDGNYSLAGRSYSPGEVGALYGRVQYNKLEPYLGVGWESAPATRAGWRFVSDIGVNLQTGAKVSLSSTAGQGNTALQQDIETTRGQLAHDLGGTHWRLGATVGIAYTF